MEFVVQIHMLFFLNNIFLVLLIAFFFFEDSFYIQNFPYQSLAVYLNYNTKEKDFYKVFYLVVLNCVNNPSTAITIAVIRAIWEVILGITIGRFSLINVAPVIAVIPIRIGLMKNVASIPASKDPPIWMINLIPSSNPVMNGPILIYVKYATAITIITQKKKTFIKSFILLS